MWSWEGFDSPQYTDALTNGPRLLPGGLTWLIYARMCVSRILKQTHVEGRQKFKQLTHMDGTTWQTYPILRDLTLINEREIKGIYLYIIIQFKKNTIWECCVTMDIQFIVLLTLILGGCCSCWKLYLIVSILIVPLLTESYKNHTYKGGPVQFDTHFEGPSFPSFQAEKEPISHTFQRTHPCRFPSKSTPRGLLLSILNGADGSLLQYKLSSHKYGMKKCDEMRWDKYPNLI